MLTELAGSSVLISDTGGSNSVQYESKPESGLVIKGVS